MNLFKLTASEGILEATKTPRHRGIGGDFIHKAIVFVLICATFTTLKAQQSITLEQALKIALQNNEGLKSAGYDVDYYKEIKKTSSDIGKLNAVWMHGQYNSIYQDNNYTITQAIPFPTAMTSQAKLGKEQILGAQKNLEVVRNELMMDVKSAWFQLLYLQAQHGLLLYQDSLYAGFARASQNRFNSGEANLLEKATGETQSLESKNQIFQNEADIRIVQTRLQGLLKNGSPVYTNEVLYKLEQPMDTSFVPANPRLLWMNQQTSIAAQTRIVEKNKILPDITVGYFNQSLLGIQNVNGQDQYFGRNKHFQGFQLGLGIPLWIAPQLARVRAASAREQVVKKNAEYFQTTLVSSYAQAIQETEKNFASYRYYNTSALPNADLILKQAGKAYASGEIGYVEYFQSLKLATGIKDRYLQVLNQYNQSVIKVEFILGNL